MNKTSRELNTKHEKDQILKVRPKQPNYDFTLLERVIHQWVLSSRTQ